MPHQPCDDGILQMSRNGSTTRHWAKWIALDLLGHEIPQYSIHFIMWAMKKRMRLPRALPFRLCLLKGWAFCASVLGICPETTRGRSLARRYRAFASGDRPTLDPGLPRGA